VTNTTTRQITKEVKMSDITIKRSMIHS